MWRVLWVEELDKWQLKDLASGSSVVEKKRLLFAGGSDA